MDTDAFQRLVFHMVGMRQGLAEYTAGERRGWPDTNQCRQNLLERYDASLIQAAHLLEIALPSETLAGDQDRRALESTLADAGLELPAPCPRGPFPQGRFPASEWRTGSDETPIDPRPAAIDLRYEELRPRSTLDVHGFGAEPM